MGGSGEKRGEEEGEIGRVGVGGHPEEETEEGFQMLQLKVEKV